MARQKQPSNKTVCNGQANQTGLNKVKSVSIKGMKFLYTNDDHFAKQREYLVLLINLSWSGQTVTIFSERTF